jgi:peptide-methionine (S)-S-oxide reductase
MKRFMALCILLLWTGSAYAADTGKQPVNDNGCLSCEQATFAGGCFWCMQADFSERDGVVSVTSGYTGGHTAKPTYEEVSGGTTGHAESILVVYDPAKISYQKLLEIYWDNIDPTDQGGQFADRGTQYRTAIFYMNDEQHKLAEASKKAIEAKLKQPVYTEIVPVGDFYPAEEYHQDYYKKNPVRYNAYKYGSGRETRLQELWGK